MAKTGKPNILIIWGDDIGWFNISANNNGIMGYRTPNIDRLAKEGCNFTDWYGQQIKFMEKAVKDDKPFFCWWNSTRMHIFTHLKKESEGKTGVGVYPDGMVEHDEGGCRGQPPSTFEKCGTVPGPSPDPIRDFYTRHPYPPAVDNLDRARDEWRDPSRQRAEFHLYWPDAPYRADLDILVAGCGTWQAAKYAVWRPEARIVGIDVSTTSLDHTTQLKAKYDLTNLDTRPLSIENAAALERSFDLIVCTGVLHHLADPDAGLRALRSVLRPAGAIYLMVYAPYGRAGVYMLQDYCRALGIGTSAQEIRDLTGVLQALPPHHPLVALLRGSRDAANPDALADALLNPRDRSYSVPQLFDSLDRCGSTLGRWYWQAPYLPQCGSIATTPHAKRLAALPERVKFAALELWRGTMSCHSVVV